MVRETRSLTALNVNSLFCRQNARVPLLILGMPVL